VVVVGVVKVQKIAKNAIKWLLGLSKNSIRDRNFILTPGAGQHEKFNTKTFTLLSKESNLF